MRNPLNPRQVSKIILSPDVVDCIVFWTKNPLPMLDRLEELKEYVYYFQFTLTGYGRDIECYRYVYGLLEAGMSALIEKLELVPKKKTESVKKKRGRPKKTDKKENDKTK